MPENFANAKKVCLIHRSQERFVLSTDNARYHPKTELLKNSFIIYSKAIERRHTFLLTLLKIVNFRASFSKQWPAQGFGNHNEQYTFFNRTSVWKKYYLLHADGLNS